MEVFWRFFDFFGGFLELLGGFFRFLIVLISVTELAVTGIAFCCFTNDFRTMMMPHTSLLVSPSQLIFGSASDSIKLNQNYYKYCIAVYDANDYDDDDSENYW